MKIYLIRHGETTGDVENRYGGAYDDHLTDKGRADASVVAGRLLDKGIEVLYFSPKHRAKEAAEIINQTLQVPAKQLAGLEERDYGILNGLLKDEAKQKHPEAVDNHTDRNNTDPEGESYQEFKTRVLTAFKNITEGDNHSAIAIVSHGGPIKLIYRELFNQGELDDLGDYGILELEKNGELKFVGMKRLYA